MRKLGVLFTLLVLAFACSTTQVQKIAEPDKTFFDAATVDSFILRKTTQQEVRKALGEPYPDPLKTDNRWTYMYTYQKQIILFFENGILTDKKWSEEYGISVPKNR